MRNQDVQQGVNERIKVYKRRYQRVLADMSKMIQLELEGLENEIFAPSSSLELGAFHVIQEVNHLKSLLEVEGK